MMLIRAGMIKGMNNDISSGQLMLLEETWVELLELTGEKSKTMALSKIVSEYREKKRTVR
jgi:hypothetical protein